MMWHIENITVKWHIVYTGLQCTAHKQHVQINNRLVEFQVRFCILYKDEPMLA